MLVLSTICTQVHHSVSCSSVRYQSALSTLPTKPLSSLASTSRKVQSTGVTLVDHTAVTRQNRHNRNLCGPEPAEDVYFIACKSRCRGFPIHYRDLLVYLYPFSIRGRHTKYDYGAVPARLGVVEAGPWDWSGSRTDAATYL